MLRLAFDFIITWRETRTRPNAYIFSNARLFVDAQNLFCITNYTGADPETDNSYSSYPNQRTFSFGIDLTF